MGTPSPHVSSLPGCRASRGTGRERTLTFEACALSLPRVKESDSGCERQDEETKTKSPRQRVGASQAGALLSSAAGLTAAMRSCSLWFWKGLFGDFFPNL